MSSQHCLRFNLSFVSFHSFLIAPFFIYIVKDVAASSFHWNFSLINTVGVLITLQSFLKLNAFRSLKVWDNDGLCGLGKMWKLVGFFSEEVLIRYTRDPQINGSNGWKWKRLITMSNALKWTMKFVREMVNICQIVFQF